MTSYFDEAQHAVNVLKHDDMMDEVYLKHIAEIEALVVEDVLLNTGDREFPDDLRRKILSFISNNAIYNKSGLAPMASTKRYVLSVRDSELLSRLHSAFHDLARRRITARFGLWTDSPKDNLVRRNKHDCPEVEETK